MSKDLAFEQAMTEFLSNGGEIQQLAYQGPKGTDRTFVQKGYVASMGASRANLKDQGIRK